MPLNTEVDYNHVVIKGTVELGVKGERGLQGFKGDQGIQVPTANNEWITVPLFSKIRRYNGENSVIWPSDLTKGYNPRVPLRAAGPIPPPLACHFTV